MSVEFTPSSAHRELIKIVLPSDAHTKTTGGVPPARVTAVAGVLRPAHAATDPLQNPLRSAFDDVSPCLEKVNVLNELQHNPHAD